MQRNVKSAVAILICLAVLYYAFPSFYEAFNYYPPVKEDTPHRTTVRIWNIFTNQRVTLDAEIPPLPVNRLPIYKGKSPSSVLNVNFVNFSESYNDSHDNGNDTWEISFLVANNEIAESRFNLSNNMDLELIETADPRVIAYNDPGEYIIQQVRNRNFVTQKGDLSMLSLGRIRIIDVKFVYFNGFDTYPYRYERQTKYYPAWKLTAKTSSGDRILMVKAL